jgi:branched-subunit amino acid ABC-type transport system permease component
MAATGLVLTYKTSGTFNFAHGAVGAATAYVFYDLRDTAGLPGLVAMALAVLVAAPVLGVLVAVLTARLGRASTVRRVVATVGLLLLLQGALQLRYGVTPRSLATPFPHSTFSLAGVAVGWDQVITVGMAVSVVAGLEVFFRRTLLGLQMRGAVDNAELLALTGRSPLGVHTTAWVIGCAVAGLSGILLSFAAGLDAVLLTLVVVQAFGAAAIGRFTNTTAAFLGGIGIGVTAAVLKAPDVVDRLTFLRHLPTLEQSLPFLVLFAVLLVSRRGSFQAQADARPLRPTRTLGRPAAAGVALVVLAAAIAAPIVEPTKLPVLTLGAVFVTVFASLALLVEVSGQISLCHAAFVALGATTFCHLTAGAGQPWLVGVAGAAVVAVPVGAFLAIPAIRLSGLYLALATFGFGILVEQLAYPRGVMFGANLVRTGARPGVFGLDGGRAYFYLCLAVAVGALVLLLAVRASQLGRLLDGLAESPIALVTHGASVNVTRVLVFCCSAAMAAVAGALYVGVNGSVSGSGVSASALISLNSLLWLVVLALVGRQVVAGPVLAAVLLIVAPSYSTDPDIVRYLTVGFGAAALLAAVVGDDLTRAIAAGAARDGRTERSPVRWRTALARGMALDA